MSANRAVASGNAKVESVESFVNDAAQRFDLTSGDSFVQMADTLAAVANELSKTIPTASSVKVPPRKLKDEPAPPVTGKPAFG